VPEAAVERALADRPSGEEIPAEDLAVIGLAVAAEEITSEVLTWGGGAYLFNANYAPITLEAALIDSRDGHRVWHKITFVAIDRKALKKLPEEERTRKEVQLRVTLKRAERKLTKSLPKAVQHHG
jgi:hypothetical protein